MQLYVQAMQIKWSDTQRFQNLILRPGVMYIVQNVCGCIGHLMQGSGLETLIESAFGGVSSITGHGKPWLRALCAFRVASSILRQSFLQTGFKTWEVICHLERARLYPTGRHWEDNLTTPTVLVHQLIRSKREGGLASTSTLHQASITLPLDTTTMEGISRSTASRCQCSCLPRPRTTFSPVHLSAGTRQAAGTQSLPISSGSRRQ